MSCVESRIDKKMVMKGKNVGVVTVLTELFTAIFILLLIPFDEMKFPSDWRIILLFVASLICFTLSDRLQMSARKHLDISVISIVNSIYRVFLIVLGILFLNGSKNSIDLIGGAIIILSNVYLFLEKGKLKLDKYVIIQIIGSFCLALGLCFDVGFMNYFNVGIYKSLGFIVPALFITTAQRLKISDIYKEAIGNNLKWYFCIGIVWTGLTLSTLYSIVYGNMTIIAPLQSIGIIINVFVGYLFMNERTNMKKKIISAVISIIGVVIILV